MTKEQIIAKELEQWFKNQLEITTLDFKNHLRKTYPAENWTQQYVSRFLFQQGLDFYPKANTHGDVYRVYMASKILDATVLNDQIDVLEAVSEPITKTKLKTLVRNLGYPTANFAQVFDSLGLIHTGLWTNDNHKIWTRVPAGKHFSKSKQTAVDISTMNKKYLYNAFMKLWKNNPLDMDDILNNPNCEEYRLLQAYITFDIRQFLAKL